MFGKVALICADNSGQSLLHGLHVARLRPHEHRFRHSTRDIVHFELLIQRIEKSIRKRFKCIHSIQIVCEILITVGQQKLRKRHWINLHEVDLAHRERGRLCQCYAQQRTGTGNVILRRILAEIFHGVDDLRAVLYFVKNDECLFRCDLLSAGQHQVLQKPVNVLGRFKELLILLVFIKVKVGCIIIITSAEFLENPRFAHLPHSFEDQRLAVRRVFPFQQSFQDQSLHRIPPSHFSWRFRV